MAKVVKERKSNTNFSEEMKILRKIVDITCSDIDLNRILKEVVKIVNEMTEADSVFVYLFDDKKQNLILMAAKVVRRKILGKVNLKSGEGITGWVAKESKPVTIKRNAYQDSRFKRFDILPEDKYEAFLSVPIIYKRKTIGVINIQHKNPYEYDKNTVNLISTIAKQVGGVIEHARLYEEARKKVAQFDSLMRVSQSIASEHYLDEILNLIVVVTAEMLNSKICSVMLLDEKKKELFIKATQSLSPDYRKKPNIKVNASLSGEVIKAKRALAVYDVIKEKRYSYRDLAKRENLTSMVAVPMIVKDRAIGIINVYTQMPYSFTKEEIDILQMVANQAAVAVENTKLMEESIRVKQALEARKLIERAKGILMRMNNLTEESAHRLICKKSMDSCRSMKEIAESIILMDELQG